jgi:hypothetical protein
MIVFIAEKFEDTERVTIETVNRRNTAKCNGKKKKDIRTNNDLQNITQKTKD